MRSSAEEMTVVCGESAGDGTEESSAVCCDKDWDKNVSFVLCNPPASVTEPDGAAGDSPSNGISRR